MLIALLIVWFVSTTLLFFHAWDRAWWKGLLVLLPPYALYYLVREYDSKWRVPIVVVSLTMWGFAGMISFFTVLDEQRVNSQFEAFRADDERRLVPYEAWMKRSPCRVLLCDATPRLKPVEIEGLVSSWEPVSLRAPDTESWKQGGSCSVLGSLRIHDEYFGLKDATVFFGDSADAGVSLEACDMKWPCHVAVAPACGGSVRTRVKAKLHNGVPVDDWRQPKLAQAFTEAIAKALNEDCSAMTAVP